jgi:hypothetical protein
MVRVHPDPPIRYQRSGIRNRKPITDRTHETSNASGSSPSRLPLAFRQDLHRLLFNNSEGKAFMELR